MWDKFRTSIHGRRLAISSSGGIVSDPTGSTVGSTGVSYAAQMWGPGMVKSYATTAASIENSGVQLITSATASPVVATIRAAPVIGLSLEVISRSSATAINLDTNATTVLINSTAGASTTYSIAQSTAANETRVVTLRGISATQWVVTNKGA